MRHITFILPNLGEGPSADAMTPLVFAILRARTPREIATTMIDERIEPLRMVPTNLVAMTVETFTARRAYEIASLYLRAGVPAIMGSHHPSMLPEKALARADAVIAGNAEGMWKQLAAGRLQPLYGSRPDAGGAPVYDRSIYAGKRYAPISLVQVGRWCRFACDFRPIHAFYGTHRDQCNPANIIPELRVLPRRRMVFFVDDNLCWRRDQIRALHAVADPAQDALLLPDHDRGRPRRGAARSHGAGGLCPRPDRVRLARPRQPCTDAQEIERRRRKLRAGDPPLPFAWNDNLRYDRVRLRCRHTGQLRPGRSIRELTVALHRRIQSGDADPGF